MAAGCLLRSGIPFFPGQLETMPGYGFEMAGTVLVAIAQPFFQCSPPLLSATWFGSSERALATATAINFNQVGIATAFIVGGLMANSPTGMHAYFDVLACCSIAAAVATLALFRERPETPPSASAKAALAEVAERARERKAHGQLRLEYPSKAFGLLRQPGFTIATATFVASIACTNVVSAFIAPALARAGLMEGMEIDLAGAGFQVAIVLGGIGLGRLVDRTKEFKKVILSCLVASAVLLAGLGISEGNDLTFSPPVVFALLLALGAAAGPVQPIAAELAVEVRAWLPRQPSRPPETIWPHPLARPRHAVEARTAPYPNSARTGACPAAVACRFQHPPPQTRAGGCSPSSHRLSSHRLPPSLPRHPTSIQQLHCSPPSPTLVAALALVCRCRTLATRMPSRRHSSWRATSSLRCWCRCARWPPTTTCSSREARSTSVATQSSSSQSCLPPPQPFPPSIRRSSAPFSMRRASWPPNPRLPILRPKGEVCRPMTARGGVSAAGECSGIRRCGDTPSATRTCRDRL